MSMDEGLGQGAPAPVRLSVPLKAYLARSFGPEQIGQFISPGADLSASGLINNYHDTERFLGHGSKSHGVSGKERSEQQRMRIRTSFAG